MTFYFFLALFLFQSLYWLKLSGIHLNDRYLKWAVDLVFYSGFGLQTRLILVGSIGFLAWDRLKEFISKDFNKERGWKPIVLLFLWSLFTFCFIYFERVCVYLFNYDCIKSREWCISYLFILFFSSFGLPFWFNRNVKPSLEKDKNVVPIPVGYDKKSPYSIALPTKNGLLPINNPQRGVYILGGAGSGKTDYKKDLDVNEIENGFSVLYEAISSNNLQEVDRLLSLGSDPNIGCGIFSPLEVSVRNKNKEMVDLLLSHGAKIIFQEDGRARVLDYVRYEEDEASKEIYVLLVSHLPPEEPARLDLEWQKDINEVKSRITLLLQAVRQNDLDKVRKLLKLGANPNITNVSSNPIEVAVHNKNKDMVSLLLSHGAEVRFDKDGSSSVFNSLEVNNNQEILDVVLCHFADIDKKDSVGLSPIHWACRDGHLSVVKHILDKSPSLVHNTDNPYKFTPLHWASRRGFKEIVELLISKGASKTATSKSGFTPLMLAISNKHEALQSILSPDRFVRHAKLIEKEWQCSICLEGLNDSRDKIFPVIPLDCGHKFHFRCITMHVLNQHDNDQTINCPNCRGNLSEDMVQKIVSRATAPTMSAFSTLNAVRQKDISKLKSLLEKGGNPNESSIANGALEEAVRQSNYEMVTLLLDYGADPTYQDPGTNNTPLHYAADNVLHKGSRHISQDVCSKILISLIKYGAIVNRKNVECETPRDRVCSCDDPLFVLTEAGGIRSGYFDDIQPAFGLSGSKVKQKILFGRELESRGYHAKL